MNAPITGVLAASLTPLTEDDERVDEGALGPLCDFFNAAGIDGLLATGTTGEGVLLELAERQRIIELFVSAASDRLKVIAHCGAQSTRDTVALAAHAETAGSSGDFAALLPIQRRLAPRTPSCRRAGLCPASLLRVRVRTCISKRVRRATERVDGFSGGREQHSR
jgi:dihydrodipicolinate synthase/N-acetylneuraminate lyase